MDIHDLCFADFINEEHVRDLLKERYLSGQIYTYIGDILLYINPYTHKNKVKNKDEDNYSTSLDSILCKRVFEHLPKTRTNQCFVVMGESGSGKTEIVNSLVNKFLSHFASQLNCQNPLIEKISKIDIVLQAFGTATTSLNDRSTRFGKYLELFFSPNLSIVKAHVSEYFLEGSRVLSAHKDEHNFHVFFLMFSGRTEEELSNQLLESPTQHRYLNFGEGFSEDLYLWGQKYNLFIDALKCVGFIQEEINSIFGALAAILNLGDITFCSEEANLGVFIENLECLDKAAILLGVSSDDLEVWLTCNTKSLSDDSFVSSFKSIGQATAFRDSFVTSLYTRLFGWLVCRINFYLEMDQKKASECVSVGFLDIFGFENLHRNNLEQLYINTTNEQIQFYFTQHIFAWEQLEYEQEGVEAKTTSFICNKEIINLLLEKPNGIFALLEEESKCLQADDNTLLSKFNAYCDNHKHFVSIKEKTPMFSVIHYAHKVFYCTEGFLQKSIIHLDASITQGLQGSTDALVSTLFTSSISKTGQLLHRLGSGKLHCSHGDLKKQLERKQKQRMEQERKCGTNKASRIKLKKRLVGIKELKPGNAAALFRSSLVDLMEKILVCDVHFVRCILPNRLKLSNHFDEDVVMEQVKYMGLVDTVRIRRYGYPYRLTFQQFLDCYRYLSNNISIPLDITASNCVAILQKCDLKEWKIGKTKVFLNLHHVSILSEKLNNLLQKVVLIQKVFRGHLARINFNLLRTISAEDERSVGNLLNSISSRKNKVLESPMVIKNNDLKTELKEKQDFQKNLGKENVLQKRKVTKTNSDPNSNIQTKETLRGAAVDDFTNRKVPRSKSRIQQEPIIRNFTSSSVSGWCRVDCYERQHHVASFRMDEPVICIDGIHPVSDKNRISFAGLPTRSEDLKVLKVKSCIGKGVQLHQDERQNLWATRLGKNPIFVRGHTLCPELVKLNGKLTQGVPMKVLDTSAFKDYMKKECETSGSVDDELREKIMSRLKVCMSFIKDTVVDEETPCWFEVWLIKVNETVNRYLDGYKKRKEQEEKRMSGNFSNTSVKTRIPPMRRTKSGDTFKVSVERKVRSQSGVNETNQPFHKVLPESEHSCNNTEEQINERVKERTLESGTNDTLINSRGKLSSHNTLRREKSMDVRLEQRMLSQRDNKNTIEKNKVKKDSSSGSPEQPLTRKNSGKTDLPLSNKTMRSPETAELNQSSPLTNTSSNSAEAKTYSTPTDGMSYRQVFGLPSSDYLFYVTPPNYMRHRRFSDSDTESMQNFVHRSVPQDDGRNKLLQNIQPKRWIKKVRRKSEDNPKRKYTLPLNNR